MHASPNQNPFSPGSGFSVEAKDGTPPYTYTVDSSPPNPEGVTIDLGPPVVIDVPPETPKDTLIYVTVTDSSEPPESTTVSSAVG